MLIDMHTHLWKGRYEQNKQEIIEACYRHNISKVYVSGLNVQYPDHAEIAELNHEVVQFMQAEPERVGGFCYVNPNHKNALSVLKQGIEEFGMSGMKLWIATYCNDSKVFPLIEWCIDYNVPILIHAFHKMVGQLENESTGVHVADLARRYPEAQLIMAHLGGNCYHSIKPIVDYPNVFVDISGSISRRDDLGYTQRLLGIERMLFGSDMPDIDFMMSYGQVEEANLIKADKDAIYYKNAQKLLWRE